jgi:N-acetylglucosaminyl-diphospho-decaprenol L-rhamnosyltransferase
VEGASVSVVVPTVTAARLERLLESLAAQTADHQTIVVDNGIGGGGDGLERRFEGVEVLRPGSNLGYSRACNLAAEHADGDALVLVNDDCVCDPEFLARIVAPLDPAAGTVMAAGVMRDWNDPERIDSAGMELDRTLLVFDYLNGQPLARLDAGVADPVGPSGAAAAFDRASFLSVGGFDERLFAYWEDVDLVLRLRRLGFRCALAAGARGVHEHSATLGSGSARKNYLVGFGRGYLLRKWGLLDLRRAPAVLARDGALCLGQALFDRNLAGLRGRIDGYRATARTERRPRPLPASAAAPGAVAELRRRAVRRARLRARPAARPDEGLRTLAIFHVAEPGGPLRSLGAELEWLSAHGPLDVLVPDVGEVAESLAASGNVDRHSYLGALTVPSGPLDAIATVRNLTREVGGFRERIREHRPDLVLIVSAILPAALIAARLEGVPSIVYAGEVLGGGQLRGVQRTLAGGLLLQATKRAAGAIVACSRTVAAQYEGGRAKVTVIYPPLRDHYAFGAREGFRARYGVGPSDVCVAAVGNITEQRGQDVLLRAMVDVRRSIPSARCLIAGEALPRPRDLAFRRRLAEMAVEFDLSDTVVFTGFVDRVADLYAAADVIVNPTRYESFGRVALEAALAGRPVVSTRAGAIPEILRDGESALLVEPDDHASLAAAIVRLLSDPELALRVIAGGRAFATEHLDGASALAAFQGVVADVLGRPELETGSSTGPPRSVAPRG